MIKRLLRILRANFYHYWYKVFKAKDPLGAKSVPVERREYNFPNDRSSDGIYSSSPLLGLLGSGVLGAFGSLGQQAQRQQANQELARLQASTEQNIIDNEAQKRLACAVIAQLVEKHRNYSG